ncbi:mitochondrial small ribosomal subunit Rsm22-domain-containing protein [Kalaharituber pfeilii]|nr:mitochondrial small ribosomal subunit Rsm22-domain-containing protein [Kalaharituber pfeilii]
MFLCSRSLLRPRRVPTFLCTLRRPVASLPSTTLQSIHKFSTTRRLQDTSEGQDIEKYVRDVRKEWGDYLPEGLLSHEQYAVYQRYFGAPARFLKEQELREAEEEQPTMTLENADGTEIDVWEDEESEIIKEMEVESGKVTEVSKTKKSTMTLKTINLPENLSKKERKAYLQLSKDIEKAYKQMEQRAEEQDEDPVEEEEPEEDEEEDEEDEDDGNSPDDSIRAMMRRTHPLTLLGRFQTDPFTIEPPEVLTQVTEEFLSQVSNKHLDETAHRNFGDTRLCSSPIATVAKKNMSTAFPIHPNNPYMTDLEADVHFATVMPGLHAITLSTLAEIRRRLGRDWVFNDVNRILDVGTGGAAILAWNAIIEAEESANGPKIKPEGSIEEIGTEETKLRATVVTGSPALRFRASKLLENTTFLPRLPDMNPRVTVPSLAESNQLLQPRKPYDLIVATNTLLPLREDFKRKYHTENLWSLLNPNGGVLVIIEKGNPLGFDAVAAAREHLLKYNIASPNSEYQPLKLGQEHDEPRKQKEIGYIIAPCTNHKPCPMYVGAGLSGRKDFCRFQQRYTRPTYMQRVIKASKADHEDAEFSYVAVRRGKDARPLHNVSPINPKIEDFNTEATPVTSPYNEDQLRSHFHTLPRLVFPPIKRKRHVVMDVCTVEGFIERWTVPKSFGKTEWRDARKARNGDIWPLGAKTKVSRNIKIGKTNKYEQKAARKAQIKEKRLEKRLRNEAKKEEKRQQRAWKQAKKSADKAWKMERKDKAEKEDKHNFRERFAEDY